MGTDVYFIAGYYGLMECIVGNVKKLVHHKMVLKEGSKIDCQVILKTVGIRGTNHVDRMLGIKEMVGFWVNGDPLMPCICNGLFVAASNFGGFSIGAGLGSSVEAILWVVEYPKDF